ncbi:hypothetical protein COCCADRAFT_82143 [Bipolaris zeicola 26-R-13]|uniref:Uncharacterized protein n=1 Tax=Cochliobolus carbonum (strain 26-R-13) TaxID=930089 RepID=W6YM33_COCC2|nr:uncharacterized protein COCCADRAFT_82143 [Bipolaris zeicola 26-R-13]EUC38810.1 hypothetical protein COCCADRAFT_82143 [Bipolaris zeicola 26-R-13]
MPDFGVISTIYLPIYASPHLSKLSRFPPPSPPSHQPELALLTFSFPSRPHTHTYHTQQKLSISSLLHFTHTRLPLQTTLITPASLPSACETGIPCKSDQLGVPGLASNVVRGGGGPLLVLGARTRVELVLLRYDSGLFVLDIPVVGVGGLGVLRARGG